MEQQCIFCSLIQEKIPSKKVYEDDVVFAILDIYPANPAHILVLPKEHVLLFHQLQKKTAEHMGIIAKRLSEVLFKVIQPDGVNIFIANGPSAGQKAPHFMMHVIPRFQGDGLSFSLSEKPAKEEDIQAFYTKLKKTLLNHFPNQNYDEKEILPDENKEKDRIREEEQKKQESKKQETQKAAKDELKQVEEKKEEKKEEQKKVKAEPMDLDKLTDLFG